MTFTLLPIAVKKAAALASCISVLTGYPVPETPLTWIEKPAHEIAALAVALNIPGGLRATAIYLPPDAVWVAPGERERVEVEETTHHLQFHGGAFRNFNRRQLEHQAECVEAMAKWCDAPLKGYCHVR